MDALVSIMVPCYNGQKHVRRLLDSIIGQTYQQIELIFVNDGSKDNTEQAVLSYKTAFDEHEIELIYEYQENKGQAAAINKALKHIHGKYVMWIDADDYMAYDHIEKKVEYLEKHTDVDVVMCKGVVLNESNGMKKAGVLGEEKPIGSLFEDILLEFRRCSSGLYMVRTDALEKYIPNRTILESKVGQNFQLLLPVTLGSKVGYLKEKLFFYVERKDSHSHSVKKLSDIYKRLMDIYKLKLNILQMMQNKITFDYMCFLKEQLQMKLDLDLVKLISERKWDASDKEVIHEIVAKIVNSKWIKFSSEKEFYIWGACEKNYRLKKHLEEHSNIQIAGYVEIKEKVALYHTIKPNEIDVSTMYIFIPLEVHEDILNVLAYKNFTTNEACYLKHRLVCRLEERLSDS